MVSGRRAFDWFVRSREDGRLAFFQVPNAALLVWLTTLAVRWIELLESRDDQLRWIGSGALIVWGLGEVVRGVNPIRRLIGLAVLAWQLWALLG